MASRDVIPPRGASELPPGCPSERTIRSWMDGELDSRRAGEVAAHISSCGPCAARVRDDRSIAEAVRAAAPSHRGLPIFLSSDEILGRAERVRREEVLLVSNLRRVGAAAALVLFASGILLGWNSFSSGHRKAEASIRAMAIPAAGALIDDENSVMIAIGRT